METVSLAVAIALGYYVGKLLFMVTMSLVTVWSYKKQAKKLQARFGSPEGVEEFTRQFEESFGHGPSDHSE